MVVEKAPCSSETDPHIQPAPKYVLLKMWPLLLEEAEGCGKDREAQRPEKTWWKKPRRSLCKLDARWERKVIGYRNVIGLPKDY